MPVTLPMRSEYTDVRAACRPPPATLVLVEANGKGKGVGRGPTHQPFPPACCSLCARDSGEGREPQPEAETGQFRPQVSV